MLKTQQDFRKEYEVRKSSISEMQRSTLRSTFHMPLKYFHKVWRRYIWCNSFLFGFSTYVNQIRSKLVGQTDLRSTFLYLETDEIFQSFLA